MKYYIILFVTTITITLSFAQDSIPELVTDRPDQTESAILIPKGFVQIETGFSHDHLSNNLYSTKDYIIHGTLIRYGLLEDGELRFGMGFSNEKYSNQLLDFSKDSVFYHPFSLGIKLPVAKEKGFLPQIAFIGSLTLPFSGSKKYQPRYIAPSFIFSFSHTLSDKMSIGYNFGAEWDGSMLNTIGFYSLVIGYSATEKIGLFVESYGNPIEKRQPVHNLDGGITFLAKENLQFDLSVGYGLTDNSFDYFVALGFSWRIPN